MYIEPKNHLGWKRPSASSSPTINLACGVPLLNRVPKLHIHLCPVPPGVGIPPLLSVAGTTLSHGDVKRDVEMSFECDMVEKCP